MNVLIVPSKLSGVTVFEKGHWDNLNLAPDKLEELKYIALYQTSPIHKITHYGEIIKIEKYIISKCRANRKYKIYFKVISRDLDIILDDSKNRKLIIQSPRYTNIEKLLRVKTLSQLFKK